jgi:hypothetical protein
VALLVMIKANGTYAGIFSHPQDCNNLCGNLGVLLLLLR